MTGPDSEERRILWGCAPLREHRGIESGKVLVLEDWLCFGMSERQRCIGLGMGWKWVAWARAGVFCPRAPPRLAQIRFVRAVLMRWRAVRSERFWPIIRQKVFF